MKVLAVLLLALWAVTAISVAAAYRPGGPIDIVVALAAFVPALVAAAAIVWPPLPATDHDRTALAWIWLAAVLFGIPVLYGVIVDLVGEEPRDLVPSFEAAYAAVIAFLATAVFSTIGLVHARRDVRVFERRATLRTLGLATILTAVITLAFATVTVVNDRALRSDAVAASRFGPTGTESLPPDCDIPPRLGPQARITVVARASVDNDDRGSARLDGRRGGRDEAWGGSWRDLDGAGELAYRRVADAAWLNEGTSDPDAPGTTWTPTAPDPFGLLGEEGLTLDGPPHAAVSGPRGSIVPEDLGITVVEGARARHCRTFIDGPTALMTFLPLRWLAGTDDPERVADWRGELDWWVFADGEIGRAAVEVSGTRADLWAQEGVRGLLEAELSATDRDRPVDISQPADA